MQNIIIILLTVIITSCGKTELDSKSASAYSAQPTYTCSQVPDCLKTCGSESCYYLDDYTRSRCLEAFYACRDKKIQIINGVIVNVTK